MSLGGRIIRDKVWFFGTYRYADLENGISRTPTRIWHYLTGVQARLRAVRQLLGEQAAVRQSHDAARRKHELSGFWQNDRNRFRATASATRTDINPRGAGGSVYQAKLNSVWGNRLQTSFSASYNNKGGAEEDTYSDFPGFGPSVNVHQTTAHLGRACRPAAASS